MVVSRCVQSDHCASCKNLNELKTDYRVCLSLLCFTCVILVVGVRPSLSLAQQLRGASQLPLLFPLPRLSLSAHARHVRAERAVRPQQPRRHPLRQQHRAVSCAHPINA